MLPSPTGNWRTATPEPGEPTNPGFTGKVAGLVYDAFGDFEGFVLLTLEGKERHFRSRDRGLEQLVHRAWAERILVTVKGCLDDPDRPEQIILRGAPAPAHP